MDKKQDINELIKQAESALPSGFTKRGAQNSEQGKAIAAALATLAVIIDPRHQPPARTEQKPL